MVGLINIMRISISKDLIVFSDGCSTRFASALLCHYVDRFSKFPVYWLLYYDIIHSCLFNIPPKHLNKLWEIRL